MTPTHFSIKKSLSEFYKKVKDEYQLSNIQKSLNVDDFLKMYLFENSYEHTFEIKEVEENQFVIDKETKRDEFSTEVSRKNN